MQTIGPYTLRDLLGVGAAGRVWRGIDQWGGMVTIAVLEAPAANDPRARWQFNSVVDTMRAGPVGAPLNLDANGALPWVVFSDDGGAAAAGVFAALGAPVRPPDAAAPVSAAPTSGGFPIAPVSAAPTPDSAPPMPDVPVDPFGASQPAPVPPRPDSYPVESYPAANRFVEVAPPPRRRRTGLLVGLVILIVLVLAGGVGGAVYAIRGANTPKAGPSASPSGSPTPQTQHSAPTTPKNPGVEPPKAGRWLPNYARFNAKDKTKPMKDLAGLGFDFAVFTDWTCVKRDQSTTYVNYHCEGSRTKTGGDLIVRDCAAPCNAAKRTTMRQQEEAWGMRWITDGPHTCYAHDTDIPRSGGGTGYGFVMVRFWHGKPGGPLNREVVLRLTAPKGGSIELHKVANSVRDATH